MVAQSQKLESLKQQLFLHSPPLEGWEAQPDGVVSSPAPTFKKVMIE